MRRSYSGSPMGTPSRGGQHQFANFNPEHNDDTLSVAEAFRHSVNLVFVRLMRDIVRYYTAVHLPSRATCSTTRGTARAGYLERFADREGRAFLSQFYDELNASAPRARWRSW